MRSTCAALSTVSSIARCDEHASLSAGTSYMLDKASSSSYGGSVHDDDDDDDDEDAWVGGEGVVAGGVAAAAAAAAASAPPSPNKGVVVDEATGIGAGATSVSVYKNVTNARSVAGSTWSTFTTPVRDSANDPPPPLPPALGEPGGEPPSIAAKTLDLDANTKRCAGTTSPWHLNSTSQNERDASERARSAASEAGGSIAATAAAVAALGLVNPLPAPPIVAASATACAVAADSEEDDDDADGGDAP